MKIKYSRSVLFLLSAIPILFAACTAPATQSAGSGKAAETEETEETEDVFKEKPIIETTIQAAPGGRIISALFESNYSPDQIDSMAEKLFQSDTPKALYSVDIYHIEFESLGLQDEPTAVFAQLFIPRIHGAGKLPLYVFGAGTTGLTDLCRTSREHEVGVNWGLYRNHLLAHAGQGTIGVLPDYMYFGDPDKLQPYFVPLAEGRVLLDSARAAYSFFQKGLYSEVESLQPWAEPFLAGFSQGGHAIFAAADMAADYAPEIKLGGLIGYGASTDIENLFREFTVVAAPIIYTYAQLYGEERFDPSVMLQDRWLENLAIDVRRLCILGLQDYYPWGPGPFFRPEFLNALVNRSLGTDFPEIHAILQENSTGLSGHGVPALILQGDNDVVINVADMDSFVGRLGDMGSIVEYLIYPDSRHDTRQPGFPDVQRWMQQRISPQE